MGSLSARLTMMKNRFPWGETVLLCADDFPSEQMESGKIFYWKRKKTVSFPVVWVYNKRKEKYNAERQEEIENEVCM